MKVKINKGDTVEIIAGDEKGVRGEVQRVIRKKNTDGTYDPNKVYVIVAGANFSQFFLTDPPGPSLFFLDPIVPSVYQFSTRLNDGVLVEFQSDGPMVGVRNGNNLIERHRLRYDPRPQTFFEHHAVEDV